MSEATYFSDPDTVDFVAAVALISGQVLQLPDGRAGVVAGLNARAIGDTVAAQVRGTFKMAKAASVALLDGQQVYWSKANANVSYTGDFVVGVAVKDAAAADSTVNVALNVEPRAIIELDRDTFITAAALGLGVTQESGYHKLEFDATAEIAMAALYSDAVIDIDEGPIFEARVGIFDIGNAANLDINFGLADDTHVTDFDSISEYVVFHLDGAALDIKAQSEDGTTTVAATDTTVDAVDDAYTLFQIDARDKADVKLYINGVRVLSGTTFNMSAYAGNLRPIFHIEKTSDDTLADVRVDWARVRSGLAA